MVAALEDDAHGMVCRVEHDGARITALLPEFHRFPMNVCPGAAEPLRALIGMPLEVDHATFFGGGRTRQNCTHMFDLAWLAISHAKRSEVVREYLAEIPDEGVTARPTTLQRNGETVLRWQLQGTTVLDPAPFAGRDLFAGFTGWALRHFTGDDLEAILVLQKGCFLAQSRRLVLSPGPLSPAEQSRYGGICFGYATERVGVAVRVERSRRDFTEHPERLLQFR